MTTPHADTPRGLLTTKRRRLTDDDTRERMLSTASQLVSLTGLTVSLEHLSYEAVIQEAQVSRSAAYRLWPTKDLFFDELVCRLAGPEWQGTAAFDQETLDLALLTLADQADNLTTEAGRAAAWTEAARVGSQRNFEALTTMASWRTYVALTSTVLSLDEQSEQRRGLEKALRDSEATFIGRMADFYVSVGSLIGFRLRPELGSDYRLLASLGAAVVEGCGLRQIIAPELVQHTWSLKPFWANHTAQWTMPSYGFTAILHAMIEPDPDFDEARVPEIQQMLIAEKERISLKALTT